MQKKPEKKLSAKEAREKEKEEKREQKEREKEMKRMERERQKEIKRKQKEALAAIREEQNKKVVKDQGSDKENRLKYLLQQTELFAHFMTGSSVVREISEEEGTPKRGRKKKLKEEDAEDKQLMESAMNELENHVASRVTGTPACQ